MRTLGFVCLLASASLFAQNAPRDWTLPTSLTLKQAGPRTWRFTQDYYMLDIRGTLIMKQHIAANYTRGLPNDMVRWNDASYADGRDTLGAPQKREFMEGFAYPHSKMDKDETMAPDFFTGFPPMAMQERNLIWDTQMLETFAQTHFKDLKLNEVYRMPTAAEEKLAGNGVFRNKDVQLTWTGLSKRNGQECAVVDYRAFFNTLDVANTAVKMVGRSHYWGQIWVSLTTKQIEYATLYEDVLGELTLPGQEKPMMTNVFRIGVFEPVAK